MQGAKETYTGNVVGLGGTTGTVLKQGEGDLTLTGNSTVAWTVAHSGLISSGSRFSGDVTLNDEGAWLELKDNTANVYGKKIQRTGEFIKSGSAKLLLTADSSAFEGKTVVKEGTLSVGNATGGKLGGDVEVEGEAVLSGTAYLAGRVKHIGDPGT